jgi:hypothetical protein
LGEVEAIRHIVESLLTRMGLRYVSGNLLQQHGVIRHDQGRLTRLLLDEFVKRRPRR